MSKKLNFDSVEVKIDDEEKNMTLLYIQLALLPPNFIPEGYFELFYMGPESEYRKLKRKQHFKTEKLQEKKFIKKKSGDKILW